MGISVVSLARNRLAPRAYSKNVALGKGSKTEPEKVTVGLSLSFQGKLVSLPCFCHSRVLRALVFLG